MILIDENIPEDQRLSLHRWKINVRQIGHDIGRKGLEDDEILSMLQNMKGPTLFTRDLGFYRREFCHNGYGIYVLSVAKEESAFFMRRALALPDLQTKARRLGKIGLISHRKVRILRRNVQSEEEVDWSQSYTFS